MTKEEFTRLVSGDVVENQHGTRKVVLAGKYSPEPITQISKDSLIGQYANWKVVTKVNNEHGSTT